MTEHDASDESRVPLVLRQIPIERIGNTAISLGRVAGQIGEMWWELVDIADELDAEALAIVVVIADARDPQEVTLLSVTTRDPEDDTSLTSAVIQLVAVMRCTPARLLRADPMDAPTQALLVRLGFVPGVSGDLVLEL